MDELDAKAFVEAHHYSRTYPAARFRFRLMLDGELAGAAVFSRPFNEDVLTNAFPLIDDPDDAAELGRFVLLEHVGANAETWFLARCFERLAGKLRGVLSFSDPVPRMSLVGEVTFPGHIGTIYQAKGATYTGLSKPSSRRLLPDGTEFSNMASGKIRRGLTGWRSCAAELVAWGADPIDPDADAGERVEWLERWRDALTRPFRHTGNHRYTWLLDRAMPRAYEPNRAYPKRRGANLAA